MHRNLQSPIEPAAFKLLLAPGAGAVSAGADDQPAAIRPCRISRRSSIFMAFPFDHFGMGRRQDTHAILPLIKIRLLERAIRIKTAAAC